MSCRTSYAKPRSFGSVVVLLLLQAITVGLPRRSLAQSEIGQEVCRTTPTNAQELRRLESHVEDAVAKALPAIVAVGNRFGREDVPGALSKDAYASGVIIREDGLVLSQYHVSHMGSYKELTGLTAYGAPGDKVDVILHGGKKMQAVLLGAYEQADVSMFQLVEPGPYPCLTLAPDDSLALGEWVVKLGHPLGYDESRGTSARLGRTIYMNPMNIVADCPTTGGDSGGPIINLRGQIVGLVEDSMVPHLLTQKFIDSGDSLPFAFLTVNQMRDRFAAMENGLVQRDSTFEYHFARKKHFARISETLPVEQWRSGQQLGDAWAGLTVSLRGSVVEVLGNSQRVAYGTVVGQDGWILTKASVLGDYPRCRLVDGTVVSSRIVATEPQLDLALLKINATGPQPVRWCADQRRPTGRLLASAGVDGKTIASGIISASAYVTERSVCTVGGVSSHASDVSLFEHDMQLKDDQFGGPIIALTGEVVGITISRVGPHGCLAIPAHQLVRSLARLKHSTDATH